MLIRACILLSALLVPVLASQSIGPKTIHLRAGEAREWRTFPEASPSASTSITFTSRPNDTEFSLVLRQRDVKNRDWTVTLNDRVLGVLQEDERLMVRMLPVPPNTLHEGENTLRIAGKPNPRFSDDIEIRDIRMETVPVDTLLSQTMAAIEVTSNTGTVPVRLTVIDAAGSLVPFKSLRSSAYEAQRTGVLYSADGKARIGLPVGDYRIYASRGFEYSAPSKKLRLSAGDVQSVHLNMKREVDLPGFVSCDTHVHTLELSGHGDASVDERVLTAAGEGLDAIVATEHNQVADYTPAFTKRRLDSFVLAIPGNEFTTATGHFNIFPAHPAAPQPNPREKDWGTLMASIRQTNGIQVIVQNHPRDIHSGYRPFDPTHHLSSVGANVSGRPFQANAMEVVNSGAMSSDPLQLVRDWMGLLTRGLHVAAIGASDTHTVDFVPIGQARTYVEAGQNWRESQSLVRGIVEGKTLVSYGLVATLRQTGMVRRLGGKVEVPVEVSVFGPSWSKADTVTIYSNGLPVWKQAVPGKATPGLKWRKAVTLSLAAHDTALVAVTTGPGVLQPFWEVRKPYQPSSDEWTPIVLGVSAAMWIDGDTNGTRTAPRGYAQDLLQKHRSDMPGLVAALGKYDESVAMQTLDLLRESGALLCSAAVKSAFASASGSIESAQRRYMEEYSRVRR